jgi:hypothetical protein
MEARGSVVDTAMITISGAREPDEELASLDHWLRDEPALRGKVGRRGAPPRADEMGAFTEALVVALGGGGAGAVLAESIVLWLRQRRSDVKIVIRRGDAEVRLDVTQTANPAQLVEAAERVLGTLGDE